ncbi:hypothetical protein V9T40_006956 [Parthenolecanium corni]|uniref:Uncharacterized protein n=1 Tax=Parthenolecanium corni TaxID=536013 RepID=A0AAN9TVM3_9HEMI
MAGCGCYSVIPSGDIKPDSSLSTLWLEAVALGGVTYAHKDEKKEQARGTLTDMAFDGLETEQDFHPDSRHTHEVRNKNQLHRFNLKYE